MNALNGHWFYFFFGENFNLWRPLLMMLFIIRLKHQLVFGVGGDWTPDLLFNHQKLYQLSKLEPMSLILIWIYNLNYFFFFSQIITNNNLPFKIYCENIVVIIFIFIGMISKVEKNYTIIMMDHITCPSFY